MKPTISFLILLGLSTPTVAPAQSYELTCEANYQTSVGVGTITQQMKKTKPQGFGDEKFEFDLEGYHFETVWHKALDTLYMTIKKDDRKLLFSTARVPTFDHNDSMADVVSADGTRQWISCQF